MITRDEVKRLCRWINENYRKWGCDGVDETWGEYFTRGLRELGLIEREPTAKEKWGMHKAYLHTQGYMHTSPHMTTVRLADAAIREAEERK